MKRSRRRSRGVAPLIIGIAAIIFGALALLISGFAPEIAKYLLGAFGGEQGVYFFLIEIPTADVNNPETMTAPITNVFDLLRNVALVFFTVALVIAGLYYALESFRLVSEGTAASIVTGSVFTALMIYLFLPLYNVVAALFNTLTSPDQGLILSAGMIQHLIEWAIRAPGGDLANQTVAFFISVFFLVMVTVTLISIGILGVLRIFFIGAVVAMMPIVLVLRLIPPTRRIAESFIDMLIGLILSSLVAAIFLRFGYEVISAGSFTGLAGTIVAWGTLIAAAMMPTVLAPRLGSLFMTTAGMVTASVSSATIGTVGVLSGVAVGAVRGAQAAGQAAAAGALTKPGERTAMIATSMFRTAAPFAAGALTGRFAGAIPTIGGIPSLGGVSAAASESRRRLATHLDGFLKERAGTATEALMSALPFVKASPLASEADGLAWQRKIAAMSDEEAGKFFRESFPEIKLLERYNGSVGREFKAMIAKASPITVSSMIAALNNMKEDKRQALENHVLNREKLNAQGYPVPDIPDEADASPTFMRDIFRYGGETARIVNAKLFHGALSHYDPKMPLKEARKAAKEFVETVTTDSKGKKLSEEGIAGNLAKLVGINNLSTEEKKAFGHAAKRYLDTLQRDSPRILAAAWKAINDPKWSNRVKAEGYTEAALKSVETGDLQNKLTSIAFADFKDIMAEKTEKTAVETRERETQIRDALRTMFAQTPELDVFFRTVEKQAQKKVRFDPPSDLAFGDFWRMVDGKKPAEKSGYTPPKPRKRGVKIAEGFGGSFTASLGKFMKKKNKAKNNDT